MVYCPPSEYLLKYALLLLNILLLIVSLSVIGLSFTSLQDSNIISALVGSNCFAYGNGIVFIIACINVPNFALAITSLATDRSIFMLAYFAFAATTGSLGALGGAIGRYMDHQVKNSIRDWMRETLIAEYGHPHGEEITFAWDHLQSNHRCCGMDDNDGDHIWAQSTWFRKQTKYPKKRVPLSCCPTCANVHQRYCSTSSSPSFGSREGLYLSRAICKEIGLICRRGEDGLANLDICVGGTAMAVWPRHIFINTRGCFAPFKRQLEVLAVRVSSIGCLFATILFACAFIAFRLLNIEHSRREYSLATT